jgi:hypothetical protein
MAQEPKTVTVALRLSPEHKALLDKLVQTMNDQAFEQGGAPVYTVASVLQSWVIEKVEPPTSMKSPSKSVDQEIKPASNVLAALEKLRGT